MPVAARAELFPSMASGYRAESEKYSARSSNTSRATSANHPRPKLPDAGQVIAPRRRERFLPASCPLRPGDTHIPRGAGKRVRPAQARTQPKENPEWLLGRRKGPWPSRRSWRPWRWPGRRPPRVGAIPAAVSRASAARARVQHRDADAADPFQEVHRSADYVELYDASRLLYVRLYAGACYWRHTAGPNWTKGADRSRDDGRAGPDPTSSAIKLKGCRFNRRVYSAAQVEVFSPPLVPLASLPGLDAMSGARDKAPFTSAGVNSVLSSRNRCTNSSPDRDNKFGWSFRYRTKCRAVRR